MRFIYFLYNLKLFEETMRCRMSHFRWYRFYFRVHSLSLFLSLDFSSLSIQLVWYILFFVLTIGTHRCVSSLPTVIIVFIIQIIIYSVSFDRQSGKSSLYPYTHSLSHSLTHTIATKYYSIFCEQLVWIVKHSVVENCVYRLTAL